MKQGASIDAVIAELQNKRDELDKAIIDLMKLKGSGLFNAQISPVGVKIQADDKTARQIAEEVLEREGKPMRMGRLVDLILQAGFTSKSKKPANIVNNTLYKAIAGTKKCELKIMGDGRIGLRGWKG